MVEIRNLLLSDIVYIDGLSIRAYNVCRQLELETIGDLLDFYNSKGTFLNARSCGKKTEDELLDLCRNYSKQLNTSAVPVVQFELENPWDRVNTLSPIKRITFNKHAKHLFNGLSVRSQNALYSLVKSENIHEIIEPVLSADIDFLRMQNVGSKTVSELKNFKTGLISFVEHLGGLTAHEIAKEYARALLKTIYVGLDVDSWLEKGLDHNGRVMLFALLDFLVESRKIFKSNEKGVFDALYRTDRSSIPSLDRIAEMINVSRERTRQIRVKMLQNITWKFSFITNFPLEDVCIYEIGALKSLIVLDQAFIDKINRNEGTQFNLQFCSLIFGILFERSHLVLGDNEVTKNTKNNNLSNGFRCAYVIDRKYSDIFQFESFVNSVAELRKQKYSDDYSLHFGGYLYQFYKTFNSEYSNTITEICEYIIFNEFEIVINREGELVFERNSKRKLVDIIYEVLDINGAPMKADQISEIVQSKYPEMEISEQSIRSTAIREKEHFIAFGRTSTYGLKKWENEKADVKGGSIRDIVQEFLGCDDSPRHVSEILTYVNQFRNTTESSLLSNLKVAGNKNFKFYPGEFIGLDTGANVDTSKFRKVVGAHFSLNALRLYNGHTIDFIIDRYVDKYGYLPIQVNYILRRKIEEGQISVNHEDKLML